MMGIILAAVPDPDDHQDDDGPVRDPEPAGPPPIDRHQFAAHLVMQECADNTVRNYSAMFVRWVDWAVTHGHDPYLPGVLEVRAWGHTINGTRSSLAHARSMIKHLCAALDVNDVSAAIHLPRAPRRHHRGLDPERAGRLHAQALVSGLKGTAVLVGLYTAGRRSEIASLAWRRVDLDARTLILVRDKTRDLHRIPLHPFLADHLAALRIPGETWVFPGQWGGHLTPATVWRYVLDVAEAAGVGRVTPHQLRHTALTASYEATGDLRAVQNFAGHSKIETTLVYTELSNRRFDEAVGSLRYTPGEVTP